MDLNLVLNNEVGNLLNVGLIIPGEVNSIVFHRNLPHLCSRYERLTNLKDIGQPNSETRLIHFFNSNDTMKVSNRRKRINPNKVKIFPNSYWQNISTTLSNTTRNLSYKVEEIAKVGTKLPFAKVVDGLDAKDLSIKDFVLLIGDVDDFSCNQTSDPTSTLTQHSNT